MITEYLNALKSEGSSSLGLAICTRLVGVANIPTKPGPGWQEGFSIAYRPGETIHLPQNVDAEMIIRDIKDDVQAQPDGSVKAIRYIYKVKDNRLWCMPIWGARGVRKFDNGVTQRSFVLLYAHGETRENLVLNAYLMLIQEANGNVGTDLMPWSKVEEAFGSAADMPFNIEDMRYKLCPPSWVNIKIKNQTFFPQAPHKESTYEATTGGQTTSAFGNTIQRPSAPTLSQMQTAVTPPQAQAPQAPTPPVQTPIAPQPTQVPQPAGMPTESPFVIE
jgi:hypothetical protein